MKCGWVNPAAVVRFEKLRHGTLPGPLAPLRSSMYAPAGPAEAPNVTAAEVRAPDPTRARVPPWCNAVPRLTVPVYGLLELVIDQMPGVAELSILNRVLPPRT